jgi:hypothetical protein
MREYYVARLIHESMTMEQLSDHQALHFQLDDNIRRMMGKLTIEQKQKIHDWMMRYLQNKGEVQP